MHKLTFLCIVFLAVFSLAVFAEGSCMSKCKYGPYSTCVSQGFEDDVCRQTAFEPCVALCPQETTSIEPAIIKPAMPHPGDCYESCTKNPESDKQAIMNCIVEKCGGAPQAAVVPAGAPVCAPTGNCETMCVQSYYSCTEKGKFFDGDQHAKYVMNCRDYVGPCLDACPKGAVPAAPAPAQQVQSSQQPVHYVVTSSAESVISEKNETAAVAAAPEQEKKGFWARIVQSVFG